MMDLVAVRNNIEHHLRECSVCVLILYALAILKSFAFLKRFVFVTDQAKVGKAHHFKSNYFFRFLILISVSVGVSGIAFADPYENSTFNFRHLLTMSEGFLGPGRVLAIAQDKKGYLWIGGDTGLARYDGSRFRMFNYDERDDHSLSSDGVRDIEVDSSGVVWVITTGASGGLNRYDENNENFVRIPRGDSTAAENYLLGIASDSANNVYLAKGEGIYILPRGENVYGGLVHGANILGGNAQDISGIFVDRKDRLWVLTYSDGLWLYDEKNHLHRNWRKEGPPGNRIDANYIRGLYQDTLGNIWVATSGGGSARISEDLSVTQTFRHSDRDPHSIASDFNSSISEDNKGNIWITQNNIGVSIFHPKSGKFTQLKRNGQDPASLQANATQFIFKDKAGDLWLVAYPLGIDYLNGDGYDIARKRNDPEDPNSISSNGILTIKEHQGDIWIGTEEGLNRYNKKTQQFRRYFKETVLQNVTAQDQSVGLKSNTILSFEEDIDHRFWVGTYGGGLHKFDPKTETFKHYQERRGPGGYSGDKVWTIFRDSTNTVWMSSVAGLARYDRERDSFDYVFEGKIGEMTTVLEIAPGKLLVGTYTGLFRVDTRAMTSERLGMDGPLSKIQYITHIARVDTGEIWIATESGIVIMDASGQITRQLGVEDGLPASFVAALMQARDGVVWATTASGVALIEPATKKMKSLYQYDGLACNSYKRAGLIQDDEGNLYLSGTAGLSIVPPQDFNRSSKPIEVSIIGLSILNRRALPGDSESPLTLPISETESIQLNHHQNMFALDFANFNFKKAGHLVFEYQLEGLTNEWTQAQEKQSATFANLLPGDYRFKVRAREVGGPVTDHYTALNIHVRPAPWLSVPAKLGYAWCAFLALYGLYAARRLQIKKMEAERSADTKTEFFATMSHEIRTPLTGVLGMLTFAMRDKTISAKSSEQLQVAKANADALLGITNDILDIIKIEAGKINLEKIGFDLVALLHREAEVFAHQAKERQLEFFLAISPELPRCVLGDPTRVAQVLKKLADNAIKFTPQGSITISVERSLSGMSDLVNLKEKDILKDEIKLSSAANLTGAANTNNSAGDTGTTRKSANAEPMVIVFKVEDTGIGISSADIDRLFVKFVQVDVSNTRAYGGTGLGLAICQQLVKLMDGEISVCSELGKGSTFQFALPFVTNDCVTLNTEPNSGAHSHQLTILCAEDFATNQVIIRTLVEDMGHSITMVENGQEAVEALINRHFHVILMDGRMPNMNGTQAAVTIRAGIWQGRKITQMNIPIIALSASTSDDEKFAYVQAGMDHFVSKPIDGKDLFQVLDKVIQDLLSSGESLRPMQSVQPIQAEAIPIIDSKIHLVKPRISKSDAPKPIRSDAKIQAQNSLHQKLMAAFKSGLSDQMIELKRARQESDFETLGRMFHGLRGSAAHLGDELLTGICGELEHAADQGDGEVIEQRFSVFESLLKPYHETDSL